ncbi:ATP-binding Cassette (ABC) Superfamily, partial [Achlya hypogyna]
MASSVYAAMMEATSLVTAADTNRVATVPEFAAGFSSVTWALVQRQATVLFRNRAYIKTRILMTLLMGAIYATTFLNMDPTLSSNVVGIIYLAKLFLALGQIPLVPVLLNGRSIFYKQRDANFYGTMSFILAQSLTQVPYAIVETVVFGSILYWVCGFANDASVFVVFLVILILTNLAFVGWLFFVTMMSPNLHVAKPAAMVSVFLHILFAGFIITGDNLPGYFVWIYWIDPFAWSLRALAVNQYKVAEFQKCVYDGVNYCARFGRNMGDTQLKQLGMPTETIWVGLAVVYLVCCYVLFLGLTYLALEHTRQDDHGGHGAVTLAALDADDTDDHYSKAPKTPTNAAVVAVESATLSVPEVVLAFQDLWYSVPNPTKGEPDLKLLKGINGYALPGTITALMGSSGAGKTTLMDVIAGRKTGGKIEGQILLNGYPATDLA